jgi:hypothetical protein
MRCFYLRTSTSMPLLRSPQIAIFFWYSLPDQVCHNPKGADNRSCCWKWSTIQGQTGPVVDWGQEPTRTHSAGPNASHYEAFRNCCGAHLVYNAFWNVKHFCVHQMLMSDPMHQVDLGVIVHLIKAILRKYAECVENALNIPGRAAARLKERFQLLFSKRKGRDGQR